MSLQIRNKRQAEVLEVIEATDFKTTVLLIQAFGKSFLMYKMFKRMLDLGLITSKSKGLVLSFTELQGKNLLQEKGKYEEFYSKIDLDLEFKCYQSKYMDASVDYIVCDEYDVGISRELSKILLFYKKLGIPMLCMSGTMKQEGNPMLEDSDAIKGVTLRQEDADTAEGNITSYISRQQLFDIVCYPISYKYTFEDALEDGIIAPVETYIINHIPESRPEKSAVQITKGAKTGVPWIGTEEQWFAFMQKQRTNWSMPSFYRMNISKVYIPKMLYNLPSKVPLVKNYMKGLKGQKIIFGVELGMLRQLTPYVITSKGSSSFTLERGGKFYFFSIKKKKGGKKHFCKNLQKLSEKEVEEGVYKKAKEEWLLQREVDVLERFQKGEIDTAASSKAMGRGINPGRVDHLIVVSYTGSYATESQKWARAWRWAKDKVAKLHFVRTHIPSMPDKFEELWFTKMTEQRDDKGKLINKFNLNIQNE